MVGIINQHFVSLCIRCWFLKSEVSCTVNSRSTARKQNLSPSRTLCHSVPTSDSLKVSILALFHRRNCNTLKLGLTRNRRLHGAALKQTRLLAS